jgi:hypothetical protein
MSTCAEVVSLFLETEDGRRIVHAALADPIPTPSTDD